MIKTLPKHDKIVLIGKILDTKCASCQFYRSYMVTYHHKNVHPNKVCKGCSVYEQLNKLGRDVDNK